MALCCRRPARCCSRVAARAATAADALALLERVGMLDQAERPCGVLAYGDLKRVELAMALANGRACC
jgi:ABC-type branched-subunit amino acid transport system ATPase component